MLSKEVNDLLTVKKASKLFKDGAAGFKDITFTVQKGEIIGILGTSGCGKSTLLRVLSGLDQSDSGTIHLGGEGQRGAGVIFQEPRLMPWLSVEDNVLFGFKNPSKYRSQAAHYLSLVGLSEFSRALPRDLSGGMAQRTAIARALAAKPSVLLLDEPFSALDAFTKMQLQDLLLDIWQEEKTTMVMVTHDIDEALHVCDRILVMSGQPGEIAAEIKISQPKPRSRSDLTLTAHKEKIFSILQDSNAGLQKYSVR
ncbi:ABC transporter ATP-binding protein [Jeotgalibacillus alimentarius]|uniref:ABC transporter ATP-binding protein n=1 Tax=Jeotgalibacillus alimentarius TaxID=135826 RepID=A0A0C2SF69_9BACL|nr:ABC transporter ATP-binding protein [Jeotgalibacillus alimentarius]KIL52554.1 ABC transporter ATP-binding protein [Jeotgalibacillus alimentarius]